jgi:hypothetical protein
VSAQVSLALGPLGPTAAPTPWPFVSRADAARGPNWPDALACLRAVERREQLQLAYRTWVAAGRPRYGRELDRLTWAAHAHMQAAMYAGL